MSVNILNLRREHDFRNEKIKLSFLTGEVSNSLSVYLFDAENKQHHVLWEIFPDRYHQSFDKTNEKLETLLLIK